MAYITHSLDDATKRVAEAHTKCQQSTQQSIEFKQKKADLEQQMEPLLTQLHLIESQLEPLRKEHICLSDLQKQYEHISADARIAISDLEKEQFYYIHVKDPKLTKPAHLTSLTNERLCVIYLSLFGQYPLIWKQFPYSEVKWQRMCPTDPEYRDKLIGTFPTCSTCDTVCHSPMTCPLRVCSLCKAQGHSHTQCPQRVCIQCKKQGHDQEDCSEFKCQICDKVGHGAKDCPLRTQSLTRPAPRSIRGMHPALYGPN